MFSRNTFASPIIFSALAIAIGITLAPPVMAADNLADIKTRNIPPLKISELKAAALSPEAQESADLAGVASVLVTIQQEQKALAGSQPLTLETLARKQKFLYLRNKLNAQIQAADLQINCTRGNIEAAVAQIYELRAYITEQRNKITHRNSQINLVSGGLTKIIGYGIALSPISTIPTNTLEIFDGAVQAALSALALREQRQEQKLEHGVPPILSSFFSDKMAQEYYPAMVWRYLNNSPVESVGKQSRRQQLIAQWQKSRLLESGTKAKGQVTVDLLDQRLAMLSDIKVVVNQMHSELMQLSDDIVSSYQNDPEF